MEEIIIKAMHITEEEKCLWSKAIRSTVNSLKEEEREVVPEFRLYPSLTMSLFENFNHQDNHVDDVAKRFFAGNAWGYSSLEEGKYFISLSIRRFQNLREFVSPEFTIFHEIGHFQMKIRKNIVIFCHNMNEVEMMCDRYGLYALVRMLYHNPEYRTISTIDEQVSFEENIRKLISIEIGKTKSLSHQALRGKFTKIVNTIIKLMSWENIYSQEKTPERVSNAARTSK